MTVPFIPIDDPGFRWGYGVFETIKVRNGIALFHQMHLENMSESAHAMGLRQPCFERWKKAPEGHGVWRWYLTPKIEESTWEKGYPTHKESFSVHLSELTLHSQSWEARYKTLSYLLRYQARKVMMDADHDEAVLMNEKKELASTCMSNLFWVSNGKVFTPSLSCGCRDGVVRRWVMESWAGELEEGAFGPEELFRADEIFLTNSLIGIMPVSSWQGKNVSGRKVIVQLQDLYQASCNQTAGLL